MPQSGPHRGAFLQLKHCRLVTLLADLLEKRYKRSIPVAIQFKVFAFQLAIYINELCRNNRVRNRYLLDPVP